MIQLLRFDLYRNKDNKRVAFPEVLNLKEDWFANKTGDESYDLSGIVMHNGGTGSGHYFSYCKLADNKWYQFNDDKFMKVNKEEAMFNEAYGGKKNSPSAYLLVYKKKKQVS